MENERPVVAWSAEHVARFILEVAPPGVVIGYHPDPNISLYDDRISFDGAVKLAEELGDRGHILMAALMRMKEMYEAKEGVISK